MVMQDLGEYGGKIGWKGYLFTSEMQGEPVAGKEAASGWVFNPYLLLVLRLILAAVFIYAAFQKANKPLLFADEIKMYGVIGIGPLLYVMAIVLPWIELLCGISLVTGIFLRGSAFILLVLNVIFLVVISVRTYGIMSTEGLGLAEIYFDCGCGFGATYAWKKLIENSFFILFSLALLLSPTYRFVLVSRRR